MARSNIVFGSTGDKLHILRVDGDPESVVDKLRSGWAQLNTAAEDSEPEWVWVNQDRVLYVETWHARRSTYEDRDLTVA